MTARIAKGGGTARRAPSGSKRKGKAKPPGLLDGLPVSPKTARKLGLWTFIVALAIVTIAAAFAFRIPQRIGAALGEQIGAAGFTVSRVELRGLATLNPSALTKTALDQPSLAMPLVDLDSIRDRLMRDYRWIKEARVHRRWPDTLVIEIEERVPAAVWQHRGQLQLVDGEGVALQAVRENALPNLPVVIGPGAQHRIAALLTLLDTAPQLREPFAGASWVGGRRWDLRFKSGETLSLPEGEETAAAALRRFAEMHQANNLLGGKFVRFDMRIEGRMIVQRRAGAEERVPAVSPGPGGTPAGQPPQDLSRTI